MAEKIQDKKTPHKAPPSKGSHESGSSQKQGDKHQRPDSSSKKGDEGKKKW